MNENEIMRYWFIRWLLEAREKKYRGLPKGCWRCKYFKRSVGDYQPKSKTSLAFDYANQRKSLGRDLKIIDVRKKRKYRS